MKIKRGDHVVVIAGKDKGAKGKVIKALPKEQRVIVDGVNMIKKNTKVTHQGPRGAKTGGIVTQEAPIHVSNVMLIHDGKPVRVGYKINEDGRKVRVARGKHGNGKEI